MDNPFRQLLRADERSYFWLKRKLGLKTEYQGAWRAWGVGLLMGLLIGALWL